MLDPRPAFTTPDGDRLEPTVPERSPLLTFDEAKHEYRVGGIVRPSVTQVLDRLSSWGMVPRDVLEAAQERGTAVHAMCEYHDQGDLDHATVDPALGGYLIAWVNFCAEHRAEWLGIEWRGYSERYGYAGTMDRYGTLKGTPYVIDIKTSIAPHRVWGMQTAAYRQLLVENVSASWVTARRATVQLRADGAYKFLPWDEPADWPAFLSLINLTNWINA